MESQTKITFELKCRKLDLGDQGGGSMSKVLTGDGEEVSSNPQCPCTKPELSTHIWEAGTAGSQGLARQPL